MLYTLILRTALGVQLRAFVLDPDTGRRDYLAGFLSGLLLGPGVQQGRRSQR